MKYLLILLLGILIGIGGELLIPTKFHTIVNGECILQKSDGRVFIPEMIMYDKKQSPYPLTIGTSGKPMTFMPSYKYAYALLIGDLSYLSRNECNVLIGKYIEGNKK